MAYDKDGLLYDDEPAVVGRDFARKIGVAEALVTQTIHFNTSRYARYAKNERQREFYYRMYFHQGHWWMTGTYEQLAAMECNYTNPSTLRKILERLEAKQIVISQVIEANGGRKAGKRYRVNYAAVEALAAQMSAKKQGRKAASSSPDPAQNGQGKAVQNGQGKAVQNGQGTLPNMDRVESDDPAQSGQGTLPKVDRVVSLYKESLCLENPENNINKDAREETTEEREKRLVVVEALRLRGVAETGKTSCEALIAEAQATGRDYDTLLRQCRAYDLRNADRVKRGEEAKDAGALVAAIRGNWPLPKKLLDEETRAAKRAAQESMRQEKAAQAAAEQAEATQVVDEMNARLEAFATSLSEAERAEIDNLTRHKLPTDGFRKTYDTSRANGKPIPPALAGVWANTRREVLMQRLEKGTKS